MDRLFEDDIENGLMGPALLSMGGGFGTPDVEFTREALLHDDIALFGLVPFDAKKTDSKYVKFKAEWGDEAVELDALPPAELQRRVESSIKRHIDMTAWDAYKKDEASEQARIADLEE